MTQIKPFEIDDFHFGNDLYIDASAGTGKTYTIQQLVAKLVRGEKGIPGIPLSKILIVTYTDKATGELRDRIRQKMEECLAEENQDCYREALQNIHTAPIFTIHSFCQKVLHDFAYEVGSSFSLDVVSDDSIETLIQQLIRDRWSFESSFQEILNAPKFKMETFVKNFVNAAGFMLQNHGISLFEPDYSTLDGILTWYPGAKDAWNTLLENKDASAEREYKNKKNFVKLSDFIEALKLYDGTDKLFNGKKFDKNWRGIWVANELNDAVDFFFNLQKKDLQKQKLENYHRFIYDHVNELVDLWQKGKRENKTQSFSDMINGVHDSIVRGNGDLLQKLRETYRYAIIDEFQDTNQLQWDIFKTIFLDATDNNIVVVGDPKQSIFSFQGADVSVYHKAISEIGRENGRQLSTNNRSSDEIIEACNELFKGDFLDKGDFSKSDVPPADRKKTPPTLNGNPTKPFWISKINDEFEFADFVVRKIVECCAPSTCDNAKTALQVFDKDKKKMRNVRFSDFAILSRTRSEMTAMENALAQVGVPYARYKDTNLFCGKECASWISFLKALNAPDFSSWNRKFLNEVLITDFFRVPLERVEDESFTYPTSRIMNLFISWRHLVSKSRWAELQESIYQETEIDKYLSTPATLQQLAKIKQIGTYIFDFLYNNHVSLEETIKHLQGLANDSEDVDDVDGNLVAKGSDFDAVNLMTIYASKGLAFPIAIITGGLRGDNFKPERAPYSFSFEEKKFFGFDSDVSRRINLDEGHAEWRRLIYVAYTRAESLMIVPRYKIWHEDAGDGDWKINPNKPFAFLARTLANLSETKYARDQQDDPYAEVGVSDLKNIVAQILRNAKDEKIDTSELPDFEVLQRNVNGACIYQYSYSSLAAKKRLLESKSDTTHNDFDEISIDGSRTNREDAVVSDRDDQDAEVTPLSRENLSIVIDEASSLVNPCNSYDKAAPISSLPNYPRGANLGDALHKVFENLDFERVGNLPDEDAARNDEELRNLIIQIYQGNSIHIQEHPEWSDLTADFIWNTMNAELPEIHGSEATGKTFRLKSLPANNRRAEMGFHLDAHHSDKSNWVNILCKGFIDLMFVRKGDDGEDYYSILDWKSDVMDEADYSNKDALSQKIADEYSVQRVLYSYLLIKWLRQFYSNMNEEDIYERHFGGIYYALARGTHANTSNGIYCQTWKSYADLERSYRNIAALMRRSAKETA